VALEHATAAGATAEHAMALGALGMSLWHGPTPAAEAVRRARTLLDTHGRDQGAVVVSLSYPLAGLLALQGLDRAALDCLADATRCASSLGFAEATVLDPLFAAGRLRPAERLLRLAIQQCRTAGDPRLAAAASRDLARVLLRLGELPEPALLDADTVAEQPAEAADQLGVLAMTEALGGDADRALRLTERAVAAAAATDSPTTRATAQLDRARTCLTIGRAATAADAADHAARLFADKGHVVGVRHAAEVRDSAVRGDR
jgi:tetratricopeptide (TPR) repeat protein